MLKRLFSPVEERNDYAHRCVGLFTGTDGFRPPSFMGRSFDATHSHYIATGSVDLDSEDFELACKHVTEHGFGLGGNRGQLVAMFNPDDVEDSALTSWRAGVEYANGKKAKYDFIVSSNAPAYLTDQNRVGAAPPEDIDGVPVLGSYGKAYVVQSEVIPAGSFAIVSRHGADHQDNAMGFRVHPDPEWQGLRIVEDNVSKQYPIIESFASRGFGVSFRRRAAAVACQLTAAGSYTAPASFTL